MISGKAEYNYTTMKFPSEERPGASVFYKENDGAIYHTYSTYARGLDGLWGAYQWLDRAPKGRHETGYWWRLHDEYDKR